MIDPPAVQELLHRAPESWRSVRARGRAWSEPGERLTEGLWWLWSRQGVNLDRNGLVDEADRGSLRAAETDWDIWLEPPSRHALGPEAMSGGTPGRMRLEETALWEETSEQWVTVVDGFRWWTTVSPGEVWHNDGDVRFSISLGPFAYLFVGTRSVLATTELEPAGIGACAGRIVHLVRARPRADRYPCELLFCGFDHNYWNSDLYELAVDREYGVVLRVVASRDGKTQSVLEVSSVEFDQPHPQGVFAYEPSPGDAVQAWKDHSWHRSVWPTFGDAIWQRTDWSSFEETTAGP
jgi:hypothetical protein